MENIYEYIKGCIQTYGGKVTINFESGNMKLDRKYVIKNKKANGGFGIQIASNVDEFLQEVERLYDRYKHSVPSSSSERVKKRYFNPLKESELDNDDIMYGIGRDFAKFELEYYVLCNKIAGIKDLLSEDERFKNKWFWQSSNDKDLVLIKEWFN